MLPPVLPPMLPPLLPPVLPPVLPPMLPPMLPPVLPPVLPSVLHEGGQNAEFHENLAAGVALPRNVQFPDTCDEQIGFLGSNKYASRLAPGRVHGAPHFYLNIAGFISIQVCGYIYY